MNAPMYFVVDSDNQIGYGNSLETAHGDYANTYDGGTAETSVEALTFYKAQRIEVRSETKVTLKEV